MVDLLQPLVIHSLLDSALAVATHLVVPALYAVLAVLDTHEGLRARRERRLYLGHFIGAGTHALLAALKAL